MNPPPETPSPTLPTSERSLLLATLLVVVAGAAAMSGAGVPALVLALVCGLMAFGVVVVFVCGWSLAPGLGQRVAVPFLVVAAAAACLHGPTLGSARGELREFIQQVQAAERAAVWPITSGALTQPAPPRHDFYEPTDLRVVRPVRGGLVTAPKATVAPIATALVQRISAAHRGELPAVYPYERLVEAVVYQARARALPSQGQLPGEDGVAGIASPILFLLLYALIPFALYRQLADTLPQPNGAAPTLLSRLRRRRRQLLHAAAGWPMLGALACSAALAVTYLVYPLGIRAGVFYDYIVSAGPPNRSTAGGLLAQFAHAEPIAAGLAGYYLYALVTLAGRGIAGTTVRGLVARAVVVALLSYALGGVLDWQGSAGALAFLVGVFPQRGLHLLRARAQQVFAFGRLQILGQASEPAPAEPELSAIPGLDEAKASALADAGMITPHDLAYADLDELIVGTPLPVGLLLDAVDTALLWKALGAERAQRLVPLLGPPRASDLLSYALAAADFAPLEEGNPLPEGWAERIDSPTHQAIVAALANKQPSESSEGSGSEAASGAPWGVRKLAQEPKVLRIILLRAQLRAQLRAELRAERESPPAES